MSSQFDQVYQAAMELSEGEREVLVDLLIGSFSSDSPVLDEVWMQEIRRRSAEIDEGKVELIPWEIVRERVHARVFGNYDPNRSIDGH